MRERMEVIIPSPPASAPLDFNFDSTCTSPYVSAPSSPQRFGNFFFSAPTSPNGAASFYREFNDSSLATATGVDSTASGGDSVFTIPFNWEEKPGIRKVKPSIDVNDDTDFEFDFSGQLDRVSLSADELFDGGKIKPLKPPPRLEHRFNDSPRSPRSPRSPKNLSPRQRKRDVDPFAAAIEQTRKQSYDPEQSNEKQRGRERKYDLSKSSSRHKATRSWSPFRVSDIVMEREINQQQSNSSSNSTTNKQSSSSQSSSSFSSSNSSWRGYRKWKLRDILLFRSASEGRPVSKETLKKYSALKKSGGGDDVKNSSFRSTDSGGSVSSSRRRGPVVSAHELHYTVNRSVTEEMKKKTFLPYNRGLLGCLWFNPAVHGITGKLGSLPRG